MKGRIIFGDNGKPDRYFLDGEEVTREIFKAAFPEQGMIGVVGGSGLTCWPLKSGFPRQRCRGRIETLKSETVVSCGGEENEG